MRENRFQVDIATGRLTLPVVILVCLILWGIDISKWSDLGTWGIIALCGYLMIEMNTTFTLIRTRTTLPTCIFVYLTTIFFFLHSFEWTNFAPLAFLLAIFNLFMGYESTKSSTHVFHSFLFLGLGSLALPQLVLFTPLLIISTITFRAMNIKSFFASIVGLFTPYWILFGYAFYQNKMPLFNNLVKEMFHFYPINYSGLQTTGIIAGLFSTFLLMISSIHYFQVAYLDKTRTRIYLSFFAFSGWWTTLIMVLQPQHLHALLPIQLISSAFLTGHLFTLTRNRFSSLFFVVTFILFIALTIFNLWMRFFSF